MASLERLGEVGLVLGGGALNPKLVRGLVFFCPFFEPMGDHFTFIDAVSPANGSVGY